MNSTVQTSVISLKQRDALTKILVLFHIIELKDSTMLRSTRLSFALSFQNTFLNVSMESSVHSHILKETSRLESFTSCRRMLTFICTTSRLNGALSTKSIIRPSVTTRTTGKTLEENLICSTTMPTNFVLIGKLEHS
jgi:hypothetical protein